jgi:hypothetical protein
VYVDTIKAPLAVAHRPGAPEIRGRRYIWDREAIFADGAVTLPDLLATVPGVTVFTAGFIAAPTATAWFGAPGRVRVYLDGVELDDLDPRTGGVQDLGTIPIWALEEVAVERAATELRVHLRSWRVRVTTPETRTDILTGSENTNLYRGFYGKRMRNGGVLQFGAQQASTTSVRTGGDMDALSPVGRIGVARGRLSVDAFALKFGRTRSAMVRDILSGTPTQNAISAFEGDDALGYVRAAWGRPDTSGIWVQALAAALRHEETGDTTAGADTAVAQTQFVLATGLSRGALDLSATARLRVTAGAQRVATIVRAGWQGRWAGVSAFVEDGGPDSARRADVVVGLTPLSWLQAQLAHGVRTPDDPAVGGPSVTTSRAELAGRVYGRWIAAGAVHRAATTMPALAVFDARYVGAAVPAATGWQAAVGGPLWGPITFEWRGTRWAEGAPYLPQVESRAELRVFSDFRRQIRRGTFALSAAAIHEYRGGVVIPVVGGGTVRTQGAAVFGTVLDMRLGTAHIFWHNRNAMGKVYETVPGFLMPRLVQLYGVRWAFWN